MQNTDHPIISSRLHVLYARACPCSLQDLATEIVLTLGEAFEVAYQVAVQRCAAPHNRLDSGCVFGTTPSAVPLAPSAPPDSPPASPGGAGVAGAGGMVGGAKGGEAGKKLNRRSLLISNAACPAPQLRQ